MIRRCGEYLFSAESLSDLFDRIKSRVQRDIEGLQREQLTENDEISIAGHLIEQHPLAPLSLAPPERQYVRSNVASVTVEEFGRSFPVDGTRVTVEIPFDGDGGLFRYRPSSYSSDVPQGSVELSTLYLHYELTDVSGNELGQIHSRHLSSIESYVRAINSDLERYAAELERFAVEKVRRRRGGGLGWSAGHQSSRNSDDTTD